MSAFLEMLQKAYDASQARDKSGKWTSSPSTVGHTKQSTEFTPGKKQHSAGIGGAPLESWSPPKGTKADPNKGWRKLEDVPGADPHPLKVPEGKKAASGVIIHEPDGRVWLTKPTNAYGGYKYTLPKGSAEDDLSLQQNAVKEAYEETGLHVQITGHAGDYERDTSVGRYYHAKRIGGSPNDAGWESEGVTLAHPQDMHSLLNKPVDRNIVHQHAGAPTPPPVKIKESGTWWDNFNKMMGSSSLTEFGKGFDAEQPRDKSGKWTKGSGGGGAFKHPVNTSKWKQDHPQAIAAHKWIGNVEHITNHPEMSKSEKLKALGALSLPKGGNSYQNGKLKAHKAAVDHVEASGGQEASPKAGGGKHSPELTAAIAEAEKIEPGFGSTVDSALEPQPIDENSSHHMLEAIAQLPPGSYPASHIHAAKIYMAEHKKKQQEQIAAITGETMSEHEKAAHEAIAAIPENKKAMKKLLTGVADGSAGAGKAQVVNSVATSDDDFPPRIKAAAKLAVASFEHKTGQKISAAQIEETPPEPAKPAHPDHVAGALDATAFHKVEGKKGSNPGGVYENADGEKFYVKHSATPDHAKSEVLASKLYEAMGVKTLSPELANTEAGLGVATKWQNAIDTVGGSGGVKNLTAQQKKSLQSNFAAHVLLGNWDAAGTGSDNQGFSPGNDSAITLDGGGSLEYRAQGGKKGAAWNGKASEWDTMRDKKISPDAAAMFGNMTDAQLKASAEKVAKLNPYKLADLVAKYGPGDDAAKIALAKTLVTRQVAILKKAGIPNPYMKAAEEKGAPAEAAAEVKSKVAPAFPQKLTEADLSSAANPVNKKLWNKKEQIEAIGAGYAAGKVGHNEAISAIDEHTSSLGSQTYHKKVKKYADNLKASIQQHAEAGGGAVMPEAAETPKAEPAPKAVKQVKPKVKPFDPEKISSPVSFTNWNDSGKSGPSSNQAVNENNEAGVQKLFAAAKTGKPDAVANAKLDVVDKKTGAISQVTFDKHPSQHIKSYGAQMLSEIDMQLNPPKKWRPVEGSANSQVHAAYPVHTDIANIPEGTKKYTKYVHLGEVGKGITDEDLGISPEMKFTNAKGLDKHTFSPQGNKAWAAMTPAQRAAIKSYTGSGFVQQNQSLWAGNPKGAAKTAAEAINIHGHEITPGTVLSRKLTLGGIDVPALMKSEGTVIQEPAIMSTAVRPSVWSGNTQLKLTVGPGVKGLYIGQNSTHASEDEMILPPNTRMVITKVEQNHGKGDSDGFGINSNMIVHAFILPNMG